MSAALITIGMTCYNSRNTIAQAIASALAQDWTNSEIVIVDDGSSDDSVSVIKEKIKNHENARLIVHEKNKGFAGALNTIIDNARGEFLAIFDDDDVSVPHRLTRQYDRITKYGHDYGASMVVCHVARTQRFPNGYERYEPTMGTVEGQVAPNGKDVADRILIGRLSHDVVGSCANCSRMARIGVYRQMNGFDSAMFRAEDTDMNIRLALAGAHFVGIAEPLVIQSMTAGKGQEKTLTTEYQASLNTLEKHRAYLENQGWYAFCRAWLDIRFDYLFGRKVRFVTGLTRLFIQYPIKVAYKITWAIPAGKTRRDFKKWHQQKLNG